MGFNVFWDYDMPRILKTVYSKTPLFRVGGYNKEETMELKKDPELMFLEDCINFIAELNDKTRALQLEYDILIGKLVPEGEHRQGRVPPEGKP